MLIFIFEHLNRNISKVSRLEFNSEDVAEPVHCLTVANSLKSNYVSKKDGGETNVVGVSTYHSNIGILGTIAERRSQGARTALVVMSVLPIVDGAINTDGPHTGRITVAVAIVLLATVARGPHVDVAQSSSTLPKTETVNSIQYTYS